MKLDELPVELLIKIFSYQPTSREIALVNKRFYGIVCDLSDVNIYFRIDQRFYDRYFSRDVMDSQWLQSVQASNRKVTRLDVKSIIISFFLDGPERPIYRIIEKIAPHITVLKFEDAFTRESIIVDILNATANVEHLYFKSFNLREPRTTEGQCTHDGEINLKNLISLTIVSCGNEMVRLFHRLPIGVLTQLMITCVEWNDLAALLDHQTNIKELILGNQCPIEDPGSVIFEKLQLESLQMNGNEVNHFTMAAILSGQTGLKSLKFNAKGLVRQQVVDAVAGLLELETLEMYASDTSDASFVDIWKLKKLKNVTLRCGRSTNKLEILAGADNTSMEKLTLDVSARMSADLISALANSAPHLNQFTMVYSQAFNGTEMDAVLRHFNFVAVLDIPIWHQHFVEQGDFFNPKLRQLTVNSAGTFRESWLTKLMAAYPNLLKLQLIGGFGKNAVELKTILSGFTKLQSLTLRAYRLIVADLDYLLEHKHNLKFVSLGGLERAALTDSRLKKLRDSFGIANVRNGGILNAAVDRYAMDSNVP